MEKEHQSQVPVKAKEQSPALIRWVKRVWPPFCKVVVNVWLVLSVAVALFGLGAVIGYKYGSQAVFRAYEAIDDACIDGVPSIQIKEDGLKPVCLNSSKE